MPTVSSLLDISWQYFPHMKHVRIWRFFQSVQFTREYKRCAYGRMVVQSTRSRSIQTGQISWRTASTKTSTDVYYECVVCACIFCKIMSGHCVLSASQLFQLAFMSFLFVAWSAHTHTFIDRHRKSIGNNKYTQIKSYMIPYKRACVFVFMYGINHKWYTLHMAVSMQHISRLCRKKSKCASR